MQEEHTTTFPTSLSHDEGIIRNNMKKCQNGACKNCYNGTDKCYLYNTNNWKEKFEQLKEWAERCLLTKENK